MKKYIRLISLSVLIIISFTFCACTSGKSILKENEKELPTKTPKEQVELMISLTDNAFFNEQTLSIISNGLSENDKYSSDLVKELLSSYEMKVIDETIDKENETAVVTIEYKVADLGKITKSVLEEEYYLEAEDMEKAYYDEIIKKIKDNSVEKITALEKADMTIKFNNWTLDSKYEPGKVMWEKFEKSLEENLLEYMNLYEDDIDINMEV